MFKKFGLFNTKYLCSADYDLYYRLILKNKILGTATKKSEIIGIVQKGGFSSKIGFFEHLREETAIRFNNGQSFLIISIIFLNALVKQLFKSII